MRNVSGTEREKLSAEIAGLESLDLNQLRARWKLLYETEAPPHGKENSFQAPPRAERTSPNSSDRRRSTLKPSLLLLRDK